MIIMIRWIQTKMMMNQIVSGLCFHHINLTLDPNTGYGEVKVYMKAFILAILQEES